MNQLSGSKKGQNYSDVVISDEDSQLSQAIAASMMNP